MSDAVSSIDRQSLLVLLCGTDSALQRAAAARLRDYEEREIVKPEIRKVPKPPVSPFLSMYSVRAPNLWGGGPPGARPHDAFYENRRSGGLPSPTPERAPEFDDVKFYSCDDAKAIAPDERVIAALMVDFCRFAWGTEVDPSAVGVPVVGTRGTAQNTPDEQRFATGLITTRLKARKGDLYNRSAKLVKLDRLFENKKLIAFARVNNPPRGGTSLWSERNVLTWLSDESYRWSRDSITPDDSCDNAKPAQQITDVWRQPPAAG